MFPLSPFSRLRIDFRFPPVGVGAPTTRHALSPRRPSVIALTLFAFSCWRRGTALRWMRSAYPLSSTFRQQYNLSPCGRPSVARFCMFPLSPFSRLRIDFRFPPVGVGAPTTRHALSPRRPSVIALTLFAFSCWRRGTALRWMRSAYPLSSTFRQQYNLSPCGRPSVARFCMFPLSPFSRLRIDFRFPPVGVGAPTTRHALSPRRPSVIALTLFAFSCWRRGTAERWMRSAYPL